EVRDEVEAHVEQQEILDQHLRSTDEATSYDIHAIDGDIGHVHDVLAEDRTWTIRYLVVDTRNWWRGKKALIAPPWIHDISWSRSSVSVALTRETIKNAPAFELDRPINREYEERLYEHYGRPRYWTERPAA